MKKEEIKVGGHYMARISGRFVTVRVDEIRETVRYIRTTYKGVPIYQNATVYDVTNLVTGRNTSFRSASKFRDVDRPEMRTE